VRNEEELGAALEWRDALGGREPPNLAMLSNERVCSRRRVRIAAAWRPRCGAFYRGRRSCFAGEILPACPPQVIASTLP
jgi:hypothetical protein